MTTPWYVKVTEAAIAILAEGGKPDRNAISARIGLRPHLVDDAILRARQLGTYPIPSRRRGVKSRTIDNRTPEEIAAAIRAEAIKDMIDGTGQLDDPPVGMPPRSGLNHDEWGRRKFTAPLATREIRYHRVHTDGMA